MRYIEQLETREQDHLDYEEEMDMKRQHATVIRQIGREADKGWHASFIKNKRGWLPQDVDPDWSILVYQRTIARWNVATVSVLVVGNQMTEDEIKQRKKDRKRRMVRRGMLVDSSSSTDDNAPRVPRMEPSIRRDFDLIGPKTKTPAPSVNVSEVKSVLDNEPAFLSSTVTGTSQQHPSAPLPVIPSASAVIDSQLKKNVKTKKTVQRVRSVSAVNASSTPSCSIWNEINTPSAALVPEQSSTITSDATINPTGGIIVLQSPRTPVKDPASSSVKLACRPPLFPSNDWTPVTKPSRKRKQSSKSSVTSSKQSNVGNKMCVIETADMPGPSAAMGTENRSKYFWY